jgi:hypothetical protein
VAFSLSFFMVWLIDWLIAFAALFVADFAWAICVRKVRDDSAVAAALWALGIFLPTSVAVIGYTTDPWLLVPASIGTLFGTFAGVAWNRA